MIISIRRSIITIALAGTAGITCGGVWALASSPTSPTSVARPSSPSPEATLVEYKTNESGQTLGEFQMGTIPPTLIEALTDDGKPGYIYLADLEGEVPSSPEEAAKLTQERVNDRGEIVVPVYAADGKTQIGTFVAGTVTEGNDGLSDE